MRFEDDRIKPIYRYYKQGKVEDHESLKGVNSEGAYSNGPIRRSIY